LKSALLEEQAKTTELQRQITAGDTKLRKAESERDSLAFRNDQLVKRVESLQESLEAQLSIFEPTKGKKVFIFLILLYFSIFRNIKKQICV